jgi:hypothetical protein
VSSGWLSWSRLFDASPLCEAAKAQIKKTYSLCLDHHQHHDTRLCSIQPCPITLDPWAVSPFAALVCPSRSAAGSLTTTTGSSLKSGWDRVLAREDSSQLLPQSSPSFPLSCCRSPCCPYRAHPRQPWFSHGRNHRGLPQCAPRPPRQSAEGTPRVECLLPAAERPQPASSGHVPGYQSSGPSSRSSHLDAACRCPAE